MEGSVIHPPDEVPVCRFVRFIDEVAEAIEEGGSPTLDTVVARALEGVPARERQAVMQREMLRYQAEVQAPAAALVRERKASRPSATAKIPMVAYGASAGDDDDASYYREALEGVEPHLLRLAEPPQTTHLAFRVSWPPGSALRSFPAAAFVSSADGNVLVLYVGPYRPGLSMQGGFYLVHDSLANSVAVVPRLPSRSATMFSHAGIGTTGVAVLRHGGGSEYLLAELLLRRDRAGYTSSKATLFTWCSSGLPAAGRQWVQKEVMLPRPGGFCADTVFAAGSTSLCWADLLQGIVMCDDVFAADPRFCFIGLPPGSAAAVAPDDDDDDRGMPAVRRSMCSVERHGEQILKFVAMDGYGRRSQDGSSSVSITIWTLRLGGDDPASTWQKGFCCRYGELLQADPTQQLQHRVATYPFLSLVDDDVVYVTVPGDLAFQPKRLQESACIVHRVDMKQGRILSSSKLPPGSPPSMFVTTFSKYLH